MKADSKKEPLIPAPHRLNDLVKWIWDDVSLCLGTGTEAIMDLGDGEFRIMVDPDRMKEAVLNLAQLSDEAMPRGGTLALTTRKIPIEQKVLEEGRPSSQGSCALISLSFAGRSGEDAVRGGVFGKGTTVDQGMKGPLFEEASRIVRAHLGSINVENLAAQDIRVSIYLPLVRERSKEGLAPGVESLARYGHVLKEKTVETVHMLTD